MSTNLMQTVTPMAARLGGALLAMSETLPVTIISKGVTFYGDRADEDYYLEVDIDACPVALGAVLDMIETVGFLEFMDEDECPTQTNADGSVRTYLAEVFPC